MSDSTLKRASSYTSKMQSCTDCTDDLGACYAHRSVAPVAQTEGVDAHSSSGSRGFAERLGDMAGKAMRGSVCSLLILCSSGALSILTVTSVSTCPTSAVPDGIVKLDQGGGVGFIESGGVGFVDQEGGGVGFVHVESGGVGY